MKKDKPNPQGARELKELIRVKIDIYGLTEEDILFLKGESKKILAGLQD